MPGRTADDDGSGGNGTKVLPNCERPGQEEKDSNADSAAALISMAHHDGVVEGNQSGGTVSHGQVGTLPYRPTHTAGSNNRWKNRRVFNSAYQRETGHIFADPCGLGELEVRNGVIVNLRREAEREREREERKGRNGGNDEGDEKRVMGTFLRCGFEIPRSSILDVTKAFL